MKTVRRLLGSNANSLAQRHRSLYAILILAFQLVYETVIATLALTYMIPSPGLNCGLDEQWKNLWRTKDENAVRRIQDRYDCCGFNSLVDRAWPFVRKGIEPNACQTMFNRTRACAGPWRQAQQVNAGIFLTVAAVVFVAKVCRISCQL